MRLIILGTGGWANTHAMNFSEIADVKIVAAVDTDEVRLRARAQAWYPTYFHVA